MAEQQKAFEGLKAKLGDILDESESILGVAEAWRGPRPLTMWFPSPESFFGALS